MVQIHVHLELFRKCVVLWRRLLHVLHRFSLLSFRFCFSGDVIATSINEGRIGGIVDPVVDCTNGISNADGVVRTSEHRNQGIDRSKMHYAFRESSRAIVLLICILFGRVLVSL